MCWIKTFIPLVLVWLISLPLYAVDVDGDGLQDYQVSASIKYTCALDDNGVHCWGYNYEGQTDVPTDLVNPVAVSAGGDHACAIDDNGIQCWGGNNVGQTDVPTDLVNPVTVSAGSAHSCAIDDNGLHCWGYNEYGQADVPTDLVNPVAVSTGSNHTCALADADDAHTKTMAAMLIPMEHYPSTAEKQVLQTILDSATATANEKIIATAIMNLEHEATAEDKDNLQTVIDDSSSTADEKTLATIVHAFMHYPTDADIEKLQLIDGKGVHCWGNNEGKTDVPNNLVNPVAVSVGPYHTCALDDNGVHCWGFNEDGQTDVPNNLVNPVAVATAWLHTCALDDNGLHCWGRNLYGPTDVPNDLVNPMAVSAGGYHTCALDDNGVHCWGANYEGQTDVPTSLMFDPDGDGYSNQAGQDAFPYDASEHLDTDSDGTGNNADTDDDNDGVLDTVDVFPLDATETIDTDGDGTGDNGDNCPEANPDQTDTDSDGSGNVCDTDDDNDGVIDTEDDLPLDATETIDTDGDGIGNNTDTDDDGDGLNDDADAFPLDATEQADSDGDGVGNNADQFPFDATETLDTDGDDIGNNADTDDDGDGTLDINDPYPLVVPPTLTFNYAGDTDKPLAGISLTHTESGGTVRTFTTDASGQVTLPATATNPYTLSASFTDSAEDPVSLVDALQIVQYAGELRTLTADQLKAADVNSDGEVDVLDAIWIVQHLGELRTISPDLVFLDTVTGKLLSETTFDTTDAPSITVIRMGDVDQSYDTTAIAGASLSARGKTLAIDPLSNDDSGYNYGFNQNEVSSLTFTYANSTTPIAGVKVIMTESDGTITILFTDANGQITLPTTSNTYTLNASLAETGDDPVSLIDAIQILQYTGELRTLTADQKTAADVNSDDEVDVLDAIWILQHLGELRTMDPSLVFLDANTGNSLSETTFNPGDTPNISVIRKGDVDGDFDPSTTNAKALDWVITSNSKAYDYSEVNITFASAATISEVVLSGDEGGLTLVSFQDNAIKLLTPIVFQDTEFAYTLTITDSANNTAIFEQTVLVELYKHPLNAFKKLSTVYTENFSTDDYAVFNFSFDAIYTAELYTETVCYEGCIEQDGYFVSDFHNGMWGNFNGDDHEDFVVTWGVFPHTLERDGSSTLSNIEIYLNNGEGRLIRNRDIYVDGVPPSSHMLYRTEVADFNKDGIDDIFAVASGLIQRGVDGENIKDIAYPHALLLSTPEGKFRDASSDIEGNTQTPCATSSSACNLWAGHNSASGDVNGDGYPDLSIGHKLFLNENGEKFVDVTDQLPSAWEDQNLYPGPMTTEIQDFNNDGFGDLVMFWADSAGLDDPPDPEILLSNGTANISEWTRHDLPIGYFGDGLTKFNNKFSGDIDGDGDLDMVTNTTRTWPSYYAGRFIQVLINDGNGNFTDNSFAALGEQPRAGDYTDPDYTHFCDAHGEGAIFLRDYDGDGDLDIIDVGPGGETPTSCASPNIFLNNGTGVFSELTVDWAWVQGTQVEGWETWLPPNLNPGGARPPEGRKIKKVFPINLDNKNKLDFVSSWRAPHQDASGTSVENIENTYQIMSKQ
jgi:hypothetical protein